MLRMAMLSRFEISDGRTLPWDGPANGDLLQEGLPSEVIEALEGGLSVKDTFDGSLYEIRYGQITVTMP